MAADIAVIMGSKSDLPSLKGAFDTLKKFGLSFEARVLSAHRTRNTQKTPKNAASRSSSAPQEWQLISAESLPHIRSFQ